MSESLNKVCVFLDPNCSVAVDAGSQVVIHRQVLIYGPIAEPTDPIVFLANFIEIAHERRLLVFVFVALKDFLELGDNSLQTLHALLIQLPGPLNLKRQD